MKTNFVSKFTAVVAAMAAIGFASHASAQTLVDAIIPQYVQGINGTNSNRVPYVYRVTINGLTPNATYRYFNQVVIGSDGPTSNGAGNVIFPSESGNYTRTSGPSLSTAGNYGEFTTNGSGSYTGWFITEPSGNATRFVPGNDIRFRIILNDGAGGTVATTRLTTTDAARVTTFGTSGPNTGTALRATTTNFTAKNVVLLYDDVNATTRPITSTYVESDGFANSVANSYSAFYATDVDGVAQAWGTIIPNALPNGIRRIEHRSLGTGALLANYKSNTGVWPASSTNTVNPSGGTATPLVLTAGDLVPAATVVDWSIY